MSATAPTFSALEATVIALASDERGRGAPPIGRLATALARIAKFLDPNSQIRRLADPRLEALRVFVNASYRRGGARAEDLTAFLAAGFSTAHLDRLATGPLALR